MGKRMRHAARIAVLCLVLTLVPVSAAFGFGKGADGPDVYAVQAMLKSLGYFPASITGYYGKQTETAVRKFQMAYGLPATGAVDDKTLESILWAYGSEKLPKKTTPKTPATPAPAPKPTPAPSTALSAEEQQMVDLVNQARAAAGLAALAVDPALANTARLKSADMVKNNYFSHDSPTYGSPFDMMKAFGISYRSAGENIACNQSVAAAHQALMESTGHRANILSKDFTHIGIGIVDGGPCGKMFTQQFIGK